MKDGHSQTWVVGHNLVTITTSGCPSAATRSGLCDRCLQLDKAYSLSPKSNTDTNTGNTPISPEINTQNTQAPTYEHRYTKVSLQHSSGNDSAGSTDLTSSSSSTSHSTQRQTSNSSTASLEALSRRGSNPEAGSTDLGVGGSTSSLLCNSLSSSSVSPPPVCVRSCTAWAEILIRRPTGNISWITRIQNPISSDCFGHDVPFSSMVSLFLPTAQGGIFGPDCLELVPHEQVSKEKQEVQEILSIDTKTEEQRPRSVAKIRPLQRQEEITGAVVSTAAIDIPKVTAGKRTKDAYCGSVSDGEADEEYMGIEGEMRSRKPVRRVNSSPEMSSSWRNNFLNNKPAPLSQERTEDVPAADAEAQNSLQHPQQKKKSVQYNKVSCEAIPEEIAGSTPPQNTSAVTQTSLKAPESNTLPPKQLSADDVSQNTATQRTPVQQSTSETSLKSATNNSADDKVTSKPPLSPAPQHSPRLVDKQLPEHPTAVKSTSFGSHQGLAKSSSGGNTANISFTATGGRTAHNNNYNNGEMRARSKTISVVREVNNGKSQATTSTLSMLGAAKPQINTKLCINPSFVFMQLYHTGQEQVTDTPIKVPPEYMNTVTLLDLAPPFETHKIGVLYVGQGQCNNVVEILRNSHGSTRYVEFLRNIGTLVSLKDATKNNLFVTLDSEGADGKFTYVWKDDIVQVICNVV